MEDIVKNEDGTYSVNGYEYFDKEEIRAEVNNAKLLYKPEFIPFYLKEVKEYEFSNTEGLVYGFIRFYLSTNPRGQFYFTNEQLAYMLDVSPQTISNSISKILEHKLFKAEYKPKANGGTFRLLKNYKSDYKKPNNPTIRKFIGNNNKIKDNNIISKDIRKSTSKKKDKNKTSSYGNKDINTCIEYLKEKLGASLDGSIKENRQYCYNLLRKMKKDYPNTEPVEQVKMLIDAALQDKFHSKNATGFKYLFYNTQRIAQSFKKDYGIGSENSDMQVI
jgi:hypothetical protein